jgi:peptidoglycan/xylan/chitin deacetylase (PgdA/CDA1 family)
LWNEAIKNSIKNLIFPQNLNDINLFLDYTLGEGRFGTDHWDLSIINRTYWKVKPILPVTLIKGMKKVFSKVRSGKSKLFWPIDDRYVHFQWETLRQILFISGKSSLHIKNFWPEQNDFSLVLTHDVETIESQSFISTVADLEEKYGFRSSFNIVGEQIPKELTQFRELLDRGFEIGIHGWQHNEKPFISRSAFLESAHRINDCLEKIGAVGMRFPLNLRHPQWMQDLNIEYDLSFFDTDPFEPIPGGTMSIWPFVLGRFIELPATLVQDNTLVNQLGEKTPGIWLEKLEFIKKYHGMALLNSHPDYLKRDSVWKIYESFLDEMKNLNNCWNALPGETARWWRSRSENNISSKFQGSNLAEVILSDDKLDIIITR